MISIIASQFIPITEFAIRPAIPLAKFSKLRASSKSHAERAKALNGIVKILQLPENSGDFHELFLTSVILFARDRL